jgi:hypothetical protein
MRKNIVDHLYLKPDTAPELKQKIDHVMDSAHLEE